MDDCIRINMLRGHFVYPTTMQRVIQLGNVRGMTESLPAIGSIREYIEFP